MSTDQKGKLLKLLVAALVVLITVALVAFSWLIYSLESARKNFSLQREAYEKQISTLRDEVNHYKQALASVSPGLSVAQKKDLSPSTEAALLANKIKVIAGCRDLGYKGYRDLEVYNFSISVDAPEEVLSRIESVTYEFNHPSFTEKSLLSNDKATHFQRAYTGWGCLASVLVHVKFSNPAVEAPPIDFNMCKVLQQQTCSGTQK